MSANTPLKQEKKQCVPCVKVETRDGVHSDTVSKVHNTDFQGKRTRFVYNSSVNPSQIEALLARKFTVNSNFESWKPFQVKTRTVWSNVNSNQKCCVETFKKECSSVPKTQIKSTTWVSNQAPGSRLG